MDSSTQEQQGGDGATGGCQRVLPLHGGRSKGAAADIRGLAARTAGMKLSLFFSPTH